jgi:preprotein translocase subunit SecG
MLQTILLVVHVLVAAALITFILLQQGRGATAGAGFGGGASATVFGARGAASFMSRTTAILAAVFLSNCLLLAFIASQQKRTTSIVDQIATQPAVTAPAASTQTPVIPAPAKEAQGAPDLPKIPTSKP